MRSGDAHLFRSWESVWDCDTILEHFPSTSETLGLPLSMQKNYKLNWEKGVDDIAGNFNQEARGAGHGDHRRRVEAGQGLGLWASPLF